MFVEVQINDRVKEYFRISDSLFYSREFHKGAAVDKGHYQLKIDAKYPIDTVTTFDPETYEESVSVFSFHELHKTGDWIEYDSNGLVWRGNYFDHTKHGRWAVFKQGRRVKTIEYDHGDIIKIHYPSSSEINKHIEWMYDTDFIWCMKSIDDKSTKHSRELWRLNINYDGHCMGFGKFQFKADGTFNFSEFKPNVKYGFYKEGLGKWKIVEDEIELIFADEKRERFRLSIIGKNIIMFER